MYGDEQGIPHDGGERREQRQYEGDGLENEDEEGHEREPECDVCCSGEGGEGSAFVLAAGCGVLLLTVVSTLAGSRP